MTPSVTVTPELLATRDFGVTIRDGRTRFKVWSPTTDTLRLALYESWNRYDRSEHVMTREPDGCWVLDLPGDLTGKYYNYLVSRYGQDIEVTDPWARSAGPNGKRGFIVDPATVNPPGWDTHTVPPMLPKGHLLIYEAHLRDLTMDPDSGIAHPGKYLALAERGTRTPQGLTSGVDYLKELGVTHLHLLPLADFATVDELTQQEYNWGYDPVLYNVPEGSYATDAVDGRCRILELKTAIKSLHEAGIRVVVDVVYNHTFHGAKSNFNYLVNNYFFRTDMEGRMTNGSGVGNELATERPMVRRFVVDSLKYWLTEYQVDGFRFDLLGLYDRETVRTLCEELTALRPDILLYGEPWVGGVSGLPLNQQFLKGAQQGLPIAVFNDDFRNDLKGSNDGFEEGFITGQTGNERWLALGLAGSIELEPDFRGFALGPQETVNYLSCHDNLCLADKIAKVEPGQPPEKHLAMARLGLGMLLSAFGIPFVALGTEFMRTKQGNHNSYNAPDHINRVAWSFRERYTELVAYFSSLVAFRRTQRIYAEEDPAVLRKAFHVLLTRDNTVVVSVASPYAEDYAELLFIHYAGWADTVFEIPGIGGMEVLSCGAKPVNTRTAPVLKEDRVQVRGIRTVMLGRRRNKNLR